MSAENKKPNVLFFLSDQHAPDFLRCCGNANIRTPNLDALAAEGTLFTNAYCQNPLCVPSRASLLTGKYSRNIGLYENRHILGEDALTLPGVFAENGYRTCLVGKTHFNGSQFHGYAERPYGDFLGQGHQPEYLRTGFEDDESGLGDILDNSGPTAIPLPMTQTEICVAEASKWLQLYAAGGAERPFFLSVNFDKPHFPYRPPAEYYEKYDGRVSLKASPPDYANTQAVEFVRKAFEVNGAWEHYGKDRDIHLKALAAYCGCVEWMDDAVGRVLRTLDFFGLAENTVVVYASDHGEMAGDKGAWQKTVFFERSAKVPLIIKVPGTDSPGKKTGELAGLIDLFPTLCEACGISAPAGLDGLSLLPLLRNGKPVSRKEIYAESVVLKVPEHAGCMVRSGNYKYNVYLRGGSELYDLSTDPDELNNLSGNPLYRAAEDELKEKCLTFWEPGRQLDRYNRCPMSGREKHFYPRSNQFMLPDGTLADAAP